MDTTNVDRKRVMQRGTHVDFLYPRCEHLLSDGEQCGDMAGHEPRRGHRHPEMVWSWWLARSGDVTVADLRAGKYGPVPQTYSWSEDLDTAHVDRKRFRQRGTHVDFFYDRCPKVLARGEHKGERCGRYYGHPGDAKRGNGKHWAPVVVWADHLFAGGGSGLSYADIRNGVYGPVPVTFSWESEELCADWNREGTDVCVRPAGHAGRHVYSLASSTMAREVTADKYASRLARAAALRAADAVEAQERRVTRTVTVLPRTIRKAVLLRDGGVCATCGLEDDDLSFFDVDHIVPRSHGGTDTPDNGQVLCPNCHRRKTLADSAAR